jgi:flavin reductase (DIM6/NTAB) family NADH-FMN oxidoreductase RutF
VEASRDFHLPVPAAALGVVELQVERIHPVGSHTVFLARPSSDQRRRSGRRMFHVAGIYQDRLKRLGRPL